MPLINGKIILLLSSGKDGCPTNWCTESLTIGSSDSCDGCIHSEEVDELHCVLKLNEFGQATICNVARPEFITEVDKLAVKEFSVLAHKSTLTVGNVSFRFEYPSYSNWFLPEVVNERKDAIPSKKTKSNKTTPQQKTYSVHRHDTDSPVVTPIKQIPIKIRTVTPEGRLNVRPFITPMQKKVVGKISSKSKRDSLLIRSERINRSKQVSFGPYLSPEQFDKEMPPMVPVKKGATPLTSNKKQKRSVATEKIIETPEKSKIGKRKFSIVSDDSCVLSPGEKMFRKNNESSLFDSGDISVLSTSSANNRSRYSFNLSRKSQAHRDSPIFFGLKQVPENSSNIYDYSEDNEKSLSEVVNETSLSANTSSQLTPSRRRSASAANMPVASSSSSRKSQKLFSISPKSRLSSRLSIVNNTPSQTDNSQHDTEVALRNNLANKSGRRSSSLKNVSSISDLTTSQIENIEELSISKRSARNSSSQMDDSMLSGVSNLLKTPKTQNSPRLYDIDEASKNNSSYRSNGKSSSSINLSSLSDTELSISPKEASERASISSRKSGRQLSSEMDNSYLSGVSKLLKTPKVRQSSRLSGVKDLMDSATNTPSAINVTKLDESLEKSTDTAFSKRSARVSASKVDLDGSIVENEETKEVNRTNKSNRKSSKSTDESYLSGVSKLLKSPKARLSSRISGVKDLMASPGSNVDSTEQDKEETNSQQSDNERIIGSRLNTPKSNRSNIAQEVSFEADLSKRSGQRSTSSQDLSTTLDSDLSVVRKEETKVKERKSSKEMDASYLSGVSKLLKTSSGRMSSRLVSSSVVSSEQKEPGASRVVVAKKSDRKSSRKTNDSHLSGVRKLLKTPKPRMSSRLSGVKYLMESNVDISSSEISIQEGSVQRNEREKGPRLSRASKVGLIGHPSYFSTPKPAQRIDINEESDKMSTEESHEKTPIASSQRIINKNDSILPNVSSIVQNLTLDEEVSKSKIGRKSSSMVQVSQTKSPISEKEKESSERSTRRSLSRSVHSPMKESRSSSVANVSAHSLADATVIDDLVASPIKDRRSLSKHSITNASVDNSSKEERQEDLSSPKSGRASLNKDRRISAVSQQSVNANIVSVSLCSEDIKDNDNSPEEQEISQEMAENIMKLEITNIEESIGKAGGRHQKDIELPKFVKVQTPDKILPSKATRNRKRAIIVNVDMDEDSENNEIRIETTDKKEVVSRTRKQIKIIDDGAKKPVTRNKKEKDQVKVSPVKLTRNKRQVPSDEEIIVPPKRNRKAAKEELVESNEAIAIVEITRGRQGKKVAPIKDIENIVATKKIATRGRQGKKAEENVAKEIEEKKVIPRGRQAKKIIDAKEEIAVEKEESKVGTRGKKVVEVIAKEVVAVKTVGRREKKEVAEETVEVKIVGKRGKKNVVEEIIEEIIEEKVESKRTGTRRGKKDDVEEIVKETAEIKTVGRRGKKEVVVEVAKEVVEVKTKGRRGKKDEVEREVIVARPGRRKVAVEEPMEVVASPAQVRVTRRRQP